MKAKPKGILVTLHWLNRQGACSGQRVLFHDRFGDRVLLTLDVAEQYGHEFAVDWLYWRAVTRNTKATRYDRDFATPAANRAYHRVRRQARSLYRAFERKNAALRRARAYTQYATYEDYLAKGRELERKLSEASDTLNRELAKLYVRSLLRRPEARTW